MSGHSKWSTIKRKKEKTDSQRAKIFTKIGRELSVVVREGGPDISSNGKLKDVIAKAKANNVPNENIERIIKKAAGEVGGNSFESLIYEGYGPCGVAVIVECLTDNRNRTAGDLRHYFDKFGGNLGQTGSVMFMFDRKGEIFLLGENKNEDEVIEAALEAGAEDINFEDGVFEILTDSSKLGVVSENLLTNGYSFMSVEIAYIPSTQTEISDRDMMDKMEKLLDMLDENDDVQSVWHNWSGN